MATSSYVDIGAIQRPESGSPAVDNSYVDIGAVQRQESSGTVVTDWMQNEENPLHYRRLSLVDSGPRPGRGI
jgi:hypothetical protein